VVEDLVVRFARNDDMRLSFFDGGFFFFFFFHLLVIFYSILSLIAPFSKCAQLPGLRLVVEQMELDVHSVGARRIF